MTHTTSGPPVLQPVNLRRTGSRRNCSFAFVLSMVALARFSTLNILFRPVISPLKVLRSRSLKFSLSSCVHIMCSTKKSFERLPTNVVPKNYALTLQPNLTEFSFTGKEVIEVEVSIRIFHFFSTQTRSYSYNFF